MTITITLTTDDEASMLESALQMYVARGSEGPIEWPFVKEAEQTLAQLRQETAIAIMRGEGATHIHRMPSGTLMFYRPSRTGIKPPGTAGVLCEGKPLYELCCIVDENTIDAEWLPYGALPSGIKAL